MTQTAKNYADALFELARDESACEEILSQLKGVRDIFHREPDYVRLLSAANLSMAQRLGALDEAFSGRVHPYVLNFLKLLCERGHIRELPNCFHRFRVRYNTDHNSREATAVTAVPLSVANVDRIVKKLQALTGKRVSLQNRVDPAVLGGVRLEFEGKELDGTLKSRLDGIEKTLSETVL